MYQYDRFDQRFVDERVLQFRDQVRRRLAGELSEEQFKPLRLMNGLYLQLHAYMLRIAIPYGVLSSRQLRALADIARRFDKGYGHFTTRQNIQFNWLRLDDVPDALACLADVQMHAIQTSGNCIRNTTADVFAGAAADEVDDPRIHAEIIRQWSTLHPEFSFLPRKFKIAVTAAAEDRAALRAHDIGLRLHLNERGEPGFEVMVGGGQGRTPLLAPTIRDFLPADELLGYLEAVLRTYNRLGRRDNIYKARIKILVKEVGTDAFAAMVEEEWAQIRGTGVDLPADEVERIRAQFAPPPFGTLPDHPADLAAWREAVPAFRRWLDANVSPHKQPGYAIVTISLKPTGGVPGDADADQMDGIAAIAERYSFDELRVSLKQNLVLPHVRQDDLYAVWLELAERGLASANAGLVTDIIACPGLDYCNLANARSIPIAQRISARFADLERVHDIGPVSLNISGCINACAHHHVANIGILGVDKKGVEAYQVTLGGAAGNVVRTARLRHDGAIGTIVGRAFGEDEIVDAIETIVAVYLDARQGGEAFIDTYRRIGPDPFREKLYGTA